MRLFKKKNDVKKSSEKIGEFKMDYLPDDQHDGEYGEHKPKAKNSESRVIQTEYEYENEKDTNQNTDLNEQDELQKRIALGFSMPLSEDVSEIKEQKADVLTDDTNFMEQQWQQIKKNYDVFGRIDKERIKQLHDAGCHDYDSEIQKMEDELHMENIMRRLRINYAKTHRVDMRAVQKIHDAGCQSYDAEIELMKNRKKS